MNYKLKNKIERLKESIRPLVQEMINEAKEDQIQDENPTKLKRTVELFYNRLDKSSLAKLLEFETRLEKGQALVEFIKRLNVKTTELTYLINLVRSQSKK